MLLNVSILQKKISGLYQYMQMLMKNYLKNQWKTQGNIDYWLADAIQS